MQFLELVVLAVCSVISESICFDDFNFIFSWAECIPLTDKLPKIIIMIRSNETPPPTHAIMLMLALLSPDSIVACTLSALDQI